MLYRVLLALDDPPTRVRIRHALSGTGSVVHAVATRTRLFDRLARESADLIVVGAGLLPEAWRAAIEKLTGAGDHPDILVLSRDDDASHATRLMAAGVTAVLPYDLKQELLAEILHTLHAGRTRRANEILKRRSVIGAPRLSDFISASPAMQDFMRLVEKTLETDATLLLTGETGVGKERLARAIHAESRRADGPFVAVNCAALPDQLLESELFGYAVGAFTGANQARRGWFEMAHGGTLFLDEIADLPIQLQAKLLRAVQDHEFQPLGSERSIRVDVRIMAATADDLTQNVEAGTFRRDLFYRLSVVTLRVPALRERAEDIPELTEHLLEFFRTRIASPATGFEPAALAALCSYSWPGNVRELRNVIERALLLAEEPRIGLRDLPDEVTGRTGTQDAESSTLASLAAPDAVPADWCSRTWQEVREEVLVETERRYLEALLREERGRIGATAERAGISPRSLNEKMRRHGLRKEAFR